MLKRLKKKKKQQQQQKLSTCSPINADRKKNFKVSVCNKHHEQKYKDFKVQNYKKQNSSNNNNIINGLVSKKLTYLASINCKFYWKLRFLSFFIPQQVAASHSVHIEMHRIQDKQHIAAEVMTQYHNYTVTFNYSAAHLDPYLFVCQCSYVTS